MADIPERIPNPLEVARNLGLNVPTQEDVFSLAIKIAELFGPQADVKEMVKSASEVVPLIEKGDLTGAINSMMMASAAIPMMALPGTVSQIKGVTDLPRKLRKGKTREEVEIQGGPLATKLNEQQIGRVLDEHSIRWEFHENGGITAFDEGMRHGNPVISKKFFAPNTSLRTIRDWLGF